MKSGIEITDIEDYTTDGKHECKIFEKIIHKNFNGLRNFPQRVIKIELLPNNPTIKSLYAEELMSFYCGLFNSSLSVGMELLEYMTKVKYSEQKGGYTNKEWGYVICELQEKHKDHARKIHLLTLIDEVRKNYRNSQNHGNLPQLLDKNNPMYELNLDHIFDRSKSVFTDKKLKTSKVILDQNILSAMLNDVHKEAVVYTVSLVNIFLLEFFILDSKETA